MCKQGIGRPPFVKSAHLFHIVSSERFELLPVNDLDCCQWYVSFPVEFDFFIAERVGLFWISFINSVISLVICRLNGSDYYLNIKLLYIVCLFNDGVLRTVIHCECFPVREIDV